MKRDAEKLTIYNLTKYYVERYSLDTRYKTDSSEKILDGLGTYIKEIQRILQKTRVGEKPLWDCIKPDKRARQITKEEFEKHCFPQLAEYIEKNCTSYNVEAVNKDKQEWERRYAEDKELSDLAEAARKAENDFLESGSYESYGHESDGYYSPTEEEVSRKGHDMMLEAIYDLFFEEFDWKKLKDDLERCGNIPDGYNADIEKEDIKAQYSLRSYKNYIGAKKIK